MLRHFDYETLEELSKGRGLSQIQSIFNTFISELGVYLRLKPIYQDMIIKLIIEKNLTEGEDRSILDFGVKRIVQNNKLIIEIDKTHKKFLPFILLREAYYCFVDREASKLVKICINQILENDLNKLSVYKKWKNLIRDS